MSNPVITSALNQKSVLETESWVMSVNWTVMKSFIMLVLLFAAGIFAWNFSISNTEMVNTYLIIWVIVAFVLVLISSFKPKASPYIAPLYSLAEWFTLWVFSLFFELMYPWIVWQAIMATAMVFFVMLVLYRTWVIKVTNKFRSVVISSIMAIALFYLVSWILTLFGINLSSVGSNFSWLSIWVSVLVIIIASLSLLIDFDNIEKWEKMWLPAYYEWQFSIWIMVTIVWLYLEILKLLANFNKN